MSRSWWVKRDEVIAWRRARFHDVSPSLPKNSRRMLLSTPSTRHPRASRKVTISDPISPLEPVTSARRGAFMEISSGSREAQPYLERGIPRDSPSRSGVAGGGGGPARVPDDLPEVAVGIAEVAGIDPPRSLVWRCDARTGRLRFRKELVDIGATPDELAKAELAALRTPDGNRCILREVAARVEAEEEASFQLEQRDGPAGAGSLVCPFAADDAGRLEAESVAVEREGTLEIFDGQRDHIQTRLHRLSIVRASRRVRRAAPGPLRRPALLGWRPRRRRPVDEPRQGARCGG